MPTFLRTKSKFTAAILIASLMAGCATPVPPKIEDENAPGVRMSIQGALMRADKQKDITRQAMESANLSQGTMSVNWEGEAAVILTRIATAQNLRFKITGPTPRLQLPVFVKLRNVSLAAALEAIGDQFGERATIYLADDVIELRMRLY